MTAVRLRRLESSRFFPLNTNSDPVLRPEVSRQSFAHKMTLYHESEVTVYNSSVF